jgi:hypothetical protein
MLGFVFKNVGGLLSRAQPTKVAEPKAPSLPLTTHTAAFKRSKEHL